MLPPLASGDVGELMTRAMAGEPVPPAALAALVEAGGGHAGLVAALARRLVASLRAGTDPGLDPARVLREPGADLDAVLDRDLAALAADARAASVAIALAGEGGRALTTLTEVEWRPALTRARAAGWIRRTADDRHQLASPAHEAVALRAMAAPLFAPLVGRAAAQLADDNPRRATALVALGRRAEACALLRALAARAAEAGEGERAAEWLEEAAALARTPLTAREHLARAAGLGALGRYPAAAQALDAAAARAVDDDERARVADRRAWLLARTGDLRGAAAVLEEALGAPRDARPAELLRSADRTTPMLRARLGRVLVTAARFQDALAVLEPLLADAGAAATAAPALAVEAATLALAYQGDVAAARATLATAEAAAGLAPGKGAYLEGLLAQLDGDGPGARTHYRRAYELSATRGEVHTLAAVALNLGALLAEQGLYGEALAATERAVRALGQPGSTAELGTALVNAANLLVHPR